MQKNHGIVLTTQVYVSYQPAYTVFEYKCGCCRLQVVSTSVGGVPEVLPPHLIRLAEPSAKGGSSVFVKYCIQLLLSVLDGKPVKILLQKSPKFLLWKTYRVIA